MEDQAVPSPGSGRTSSPNFDLGLEFDSDDMFNLTNAWDWNSETDDEQLLQCLSAIESENPTSIMHTSPMTTDGNAPGAGGEIPDNMAEDTPTPTAKKPRRHAALTEADLIALEKDKDEKNTIQVTEWAVRTINGKRKT